MADTLRLHKRTILIAEDAYLVALEAQRIVEEAGATQVLLAASVEDVRSALASQDKIDICILNLRLGQENAEPLIKEMQDRDVPVLVATGFNSTGPSIKVPILRKPYQENELVEAILSTMRPDEPK